MGNFFTLSSVPTFLGCLLLGAVYAWILYGTNRSLSTKLKNSLSALRVLLVALVAWLLLAPLVKTISYTPEKPVIVIAHDNSLSVAHVEPANFNRQQYEKDLQSLANQLSDKYEVKTFNFGDSVRTGLDFSRQAKVSNVSALLDRLNDELANRNVGAVVLASDGIFNRGGNPLYEINKIKAPFYTVGLGDTIPKRDVLIGNINYNDLVYLDNDFTLDVQVQAYDSKGETTKLAVFENGKKIKEQEILIDAATFVRDITLKIKADKVGMRRYVVSLSGLKNEITTKNNTQTIFVEVIDARQKVLLAAASPHPDLATLKQAIERNQHYEVTLALAEELDQQDVAKFGLAILYQLPNESNSASSLIARLKSAKTPIWYVLGAQTNLSAFNQVERNLSFGRANGSLQEIFPYPEANFTVFGLDQDALKQLANYDPLQVPFATLSINGSYSAAFLQRIGRVNTRNPLLFFINTDAAKVGVLMGEGIWKWKLEEAKDDNSYPFTDELISKSVQYLAAKDDKRKFKVYSSKSAYDENENVILNAVLYNDAYEPINAPEVALELKNGKGKTYNYTFSKSGSAYRLDAGMLPPGDYTFAGSTTLGTKRYSATGAFFVNSVIAEYQQTTANHQLLYALSKQSNGQLFMPSKLLAIANEIEKNGQAKTIVYEDRKYDELVSFKWLFILILTLLTGEWFLRKRNGEV